MINGTHSPYVSYVSNLKTNNALLCQISIIVCAYISFVYQSFVISIAPSLCI